MGQHKDIELYHLRHAQMLAYQRRIAPLVPTIRGIMDAWHIASTSHTHYVLSNLVEMGLVVAYRNGKTNKYIAEEE